MDPPPAEGNFCDDSIHPVEPHNVEQYNQHMGYVASSDHVANSCLISRCTFKWTMKLFFHHLDLTVLNSWILLSSCGAKCTHWDFRLFLVRNLKKLERAKIAPPPDWLEYRVRPQQMLCDTSHRTSTGQWSHPPTSVAICSYCQRKGSVCKCAICDVSLCVVPCFAEYHNGVNL